MSLFGKEGFSTSRELGGLCKSALKALDSSHLRGVPAGREVNVLKGRKTDTLLLALTPRLEVKEQILAADREGVAFRVTGSLDCALSAACRSARAQCVCVCFPEPV